MQKFIIQGGNPLKGSIQPSGAKNAALKMIVAALLTNEEVILENVPKILDVLTLIEIMESIGVQFRWLDDHMLSILCKNIDPVKINQEKVGHLRASIILIAPILTRNHSLTIHVPGGCLIGARSITPNINVFKSFGAIVNEDNNYLHFSANTIIGKRVILDQLSVSSTENALLLAVCAKGLSEIHVCAVEPEIANLIDLLNSMGAKIKGKNTSTLLIEGVESLHGTKHAIIPDRIESGTFACAFAATGGEGIINNIIPDHLDNILNKFSKIGIPFRFKKTVNAKQGLELNDLIIERAHELKNIDFDTRPFPGFSTDLQSSMVVLLTQAKGDSKIFETLFEGRLQYVEKLNMMGAHIAIKDQYTVVIHGSTPLKGNIIESPDLRAGAAFVLAGLIASGETTVCNAGIVDRGYEDFSGKLKQIGAAITRSS